MKCNCAVVTTNSPHNNLNTVDHLLPTQALTHVRMRPCESSVKELIMLLYVLGSVTWDGSYTSNAVQCASLLVPRMKYGSLQ